MTRASQHATIARGAGVLLTLVLVGAGLHGWLQPAARFPLLVPLAFCG